MRTKDYLREIEKKYSPKNDSHLADLLGVRPPTIYRYKSEERVMADEVCEKVADLLDIPLEKILLDMHIQSSPTPKIKNAWKALQMSVALVWVPICILCKIIKDRQNVRRLSEIYI